MRQSNMVPRQFNAAPVMDPPTQKLRALVIGVLVVVVAGALGLMFKLQMASPIQGQQNTTADSAADPSAMDATYPASQTANQQVAPPVAQQTIQPAVTPPSAVDAGAGKLVLDVWVEAGALHLRSNLQQEVEIYSLADAGQRQTLMLDPGQDVTAPLAPAAAPELAGKTAHLEASVSGGRMSITTAPSGLQVYVNRQKWPTTNYNLAAPNRIGFNFPDTKAAYGIALTAVELAGVPSP